MNGSCGTLRSPFMTFLDVLDLSCWDIFNSTYGIIIRASMCLHDLFIYFFTFLSLFSLHKLQGGERREKNKEIKKTLNTHWNSDNNTISIVEKISTRWIQQHQRKVKRWLECAIRAVQRQISPDIFEWLMWPTLVTVCYLSRCYSTRLVNIFSTILVLLSFKFRWVSEFFFSLFPFSFPFIKNSVSLFLELERITWHLQCHLQESCRYHLQKIHRYDLQLSKYIIFSKYFLYCIILSSFL